MGEQMKNAFDGIFRISTKELVTSQKKQAAQVKQRKIRGEKGTDHFKNYVIGNKRNDK